MTYFKGDIVEIITARYNNWGEIPKHERGYFENQDEPAPFVGQRFRIDVIGKALSLTPAYLYGRRMCLQTRPEHVRLYKRPLCNWLKALRRWLLDIKFYSDKL